jgi:hypothetical protein
MSTSILYHTFGIRSVQHIRSDFLMAKQYFTARLPPAKFSVRCAEAVM